MNSRPRREGERGLDGLPPEGLCELEMLQREIKHEVDMLPKGSPNDGRHRGGREAEALRQSRRKLGALRPEVPPHPEWAQ